MKHCHSSLTVLLTNANSSPLVNKLILVGSGLKTCNKCLFDQTSKTEAVPNHTRLCSNFLKSITVNVVWPILLINMNVNIHCIRASNIHVYDYFIAIDYL